jgi:hypothetical protein
MKISYIYDVLSFADNKKNKKRLLKNQKKEKNMKKNNISWDEKRKIT